jgi:hypothetical protein
MKNIKTFLTAGLFSLAIAIAGLAFDPSTAWLRAAQKYNDEGKRSFLPCRPRQEVVERMLELAQVKKGDVVMISAPATAESLSRRPKCLRQGHRFLKLTRNASKNPPRILKAGVGDLVEIIASTMTRAIDLSPATVLTMYLPSRGES